MDQDVFLGSKASLFFRDESRAIIHPSFIYAALVYPFSSRWMERTGLVTMRISST
jgi:hypothetical protein